MHQLYRRARHCRGRSGGADRVGPRGQAYDLTGSEALDYWQVAEIMSQILDRKITYRNPNLLTFLAGHVRRGTPLMFALVMTGLYSRRANGMAAAGDR